MDQSLGGARFRRSVTVAAAVVVAAFVVLVGAIVAGQSRLAQKSLAESSLALVVGRTMDVRFVVDRLPRVPRRLASMLLDERGSELRQAIAWYEEMAARTPEPAVEMQLAILEGEAGRRARLGEKLEAWDVRRDPYPAMAAAVGAAYLGRADEAVDEQVVDHLPADGQPWFGEQLALRLALRRGDQVHATQILGERAQRTAPLVRRVLALTAVELGLVIAGVAGALALFAGGGLRIAGAPLPPPWSGHVGAIVLVRGVAVQAALFVALYLVVRAADSEVLDALTWPWSDFFFVPLLVLARRHLARPFALRLRDVFGLVPDTERRWRLPAVAAVVVTLGLAGDWVISSVAGRLGVMSHWAEGFDDDLVWGGGGDAAIALVSAVIVAPVFEEMVFRGLLFATLRRRLGVFGAALAGALVFAVAHGYGWVGFASVLWSGVLWAWSYERTRSLLPGMIGHAVANLLASLGLLLILRS